MKLVHISGVESGLKCACFCPSCNSALVARKGEKVMHHFAHYHADECSYGYETSLHLAAKQMIAESRKFVIPAVYLNFAHSGKENILLSEAKEITVDEVFLEQRQGDMISDVVVVSKNKKINIEICVTHAIDETKRLKLIKNNISTIEIDLSSYGKNPTREELRKIILDDSEQKKWVYNSYAIYYFNKFQSAAEHKPIIKRGYALHVDHCPIRVREWRGKPYANFIEDCTYCEFCISYEVENKVLCSGKMRIATLEDLSKTLEERKRFYDEKHEDEKHDSFLQGICPNCGSKLIKRSGKFGEFTGCTKYPHCRFTVNIDKETGEIFMRS